MKVCCLVAVTAALSVSTAAFAQDNGGEALFKKHFCSVCHAPDTKVVGPSLAEIAAKRKSEEGAVATLTARIRAGGKDVYGPIPMPPAPPAATDDEINAIVAWMLDR